MVKAFKLLAVALVISGFLIPSTPAASSTSSTIAAPVKKKNSLIKFSGTVIDNQSLKEHKDSLAAFLPRLTTEDVWNNIKYGYSIYLDNGKIYNLCRETSSNIWNDIKSPRGGSTMRSLKISGNARIIGDSLRIADFIVNK